MGDMLEKEADGDLMYTFPEDYREKKDGVRYGRIETVHYYSKTVGRERRATVVLPPDYTEDKSYPVLYMCHGLGQDDIQWLAEGRADIIIGNMTAAGMAEEMIMVMPNCRARENDEGNPPDAFSINNYMAFDNFYNDFKADLKPFIEEKYHVAAGRENTAVIGFSMGGRVALHLGLGMQDTFGYLAACCPAPGIFAYDMNGVSENGLFTEETFMVRPEYKGKTKAMIIAGKSDCVVFGHPESYHDALKKNGTEHIWCKFAGGHDFDVVDKGLYIFAKELFKK